MIPLEVIGLTNDMDKDRKVFGSFEKVSIPSLGIFDVVAKIDTGAYSGALHCSNIEEHTNNGKKGTLCFTPFENDSHSKEIKKYRRAYVRSSTGHRVRRYLFETVIVIDEKEYPIRIGLSDRSDMNYEILIGRRFLRDNNILVDVCVNQEFDSDGEKRL